MNKIRTAVITGQDFFFEIGLNRTFPKHHLKQPSIFMTPLFSRCLVSAGLFQPKVICDSDEFVSSERKIKALKSEMINN